MALLVDERFEGAADGVALSTGNTSASEVNNTVVFDDGGPVADGTRAALIVASASSHRIRWAGLPATSQLRISVYQAFSQLPGTSTRVVEWRDAGGALIGDLRVDVDGTLQLRNGGTVIATAAALPVGRLWRAEADLVLATDGTGTGAVRTYHGATDLHAHNLTPASAPAPATGLTWSAAATRVDAGTLENETWSQWIDALRVDDARQPGSLATRAVWDGTAWVPVVGSYVWDGTAWVAVA